MIQPGKCNILISQRCSVSDGMAVHPAEIPNSLQYTQMIWWVLMANAVAYSNAVHETAVLDAIHLKYIPAFKTFKWWIWFYAMSFYCIAASSVFASIFVSVFVIALAPDLYLHLTCIFIRKCICICLCIWMCICIAIMLLLQPLFSVCLSFTPSGNQYSPHIYVFYICYICVNIFVIFGICVCNICYNCVLYLRYICVCWSSTPSGNQHSPHICHRTHHPRPHYIQPKVWNLSRS